MELPNRGCSDGLDAFKRGLVRFYGEKAHHRLQAMLEIYNLQAKKAVTSGAWCREVVSRDRSLVLCAGLDGPISYSSYILKTKQPSLNSELIKTFQTAERIPTQNELLYGKQDMLVSFCRGSNEYSMAMYCYMSLKCFSIFYRMPFSKLTSLLEFSVEIQSIVKNWRAHHPCVSEREKFTH